MWIILFLFGSLVVAGLARKFGGHTFINGYMSEEQADDVFPEWRGKSKEDQEKK